VRQRLRRLGTSSNELGSRAMGLRVAGAGLLIATAAIHGDLYLTGYRHIPVIGWLFLLQVITAFVLGVAVLATGNRLISLAGAGFSVATLGGYLLSIWFGLFGFTEVRTTAGIVAGVVEIAAFAALAVLALAPPTPAESASPATPGTGRAATPTQDRAGAPSRPWLAMLQAGVPRVSRIVAALSVLALVVLGVTVAQANGPGPGATASSQSGRAALVIVINNFKFVPAAPHVQPGQRVEVKNEDSPPHTLSAGPAAKFAKDFNTGTINPGKVKFFTAPTKPGAYPFYCMIHTFMTGTLLVGHVSAAAELAAIAKSLPALHTYCGLPPARQTLSSRGGPPRLLTLSRR
jgi:plastocyanin